MYNIQMKRYDNQWGPNTNAAATTFPINFNTCLQAFAQYTGTSSDSDANYDQTPVSITGSGFSLYITGKYAYPYRWWAIGK